MISRMTAELLLTFSPTITFFFSLLLITSDRGQSIRACAPQDVSTSTSAIPGCYLVPE